MRKVDPNYYRDNIHQRARGRGNILLNGSNNNIHLSSAITHPPKEVELKVIANIGVYIAFLGIVVATLFYILMVKVVGNLIKYDYISKEYWGAALIAVILIVGAFTIWDIQRGEWFRKKVIYCYGVNINAKRPTYRLPLVFLNESEAKYLYDIFHTGKYLKRED